MRSPTGISLMHFPHLPLLPQISVGVIGGKQYKELTELIARFALQGPFHFIVGGEWVPDQDSLRRAVRRYTTALDRILERPVLGRPSTCLQLRDQLEMAHAQPHPVFLLDPLHHFYDPDVDLTLRQRVLLECCQQLQRLAHSRAVFLLVYRVPTDEYQQFFPLLASIAKEIIEEEENFHIEVQQLRLL